MTQTAHPDSVLIVDFGSQVTQLIARRVREAGVYCEIVPFQSAEEGFKRLQPKAVILSRQPGLNGGRGIAAGASNYLRQRPAGSSASAMASKRCACSSAARSKAAITGNSAAPFLDVDKNCPAVRGLWSSGSRHQVWMRPWRPRDGAARRFRGGRHLLQRALMLSSRTRSANITACSSTPRSCIRLTAPS